MISDLILSFFAFGFFYKLKDMDANWSLFFGFMSLSAFSGALYHGFNNLGESLRFFSWSMLAVSIIFAQRASYLEYNSKILNAIFILSGIIFLSLSIVYSNFIFMVINMIIGLFGFVVLGGLIFLKDNSKKIIIGILISFSSVFFVITKTSIHDEYLNYNDIGHYISILSLYIVTLGVREDIGEVCELPQ